MAVPSKDRNLRQLQARGLSPASFTIRQATSQDIPVLARLHVTTWNATYAPLLMKGPSYEVREQQWQEQFEKREPGFCCFVAEAPSGELVGFAQGARSDHPEYGGLLSKIYVLKEYQRMGIGKRLLGHVARRFQSLGVNSMWLYGDARNPSSAVWLALGARKTDPDPGNGNYGWSDLHGLATLPD